MTSDIKPKIKEEAASEKEKASSPDLCGCIVLDACGCYADPCGCYVNPCGCYMDACGCDC